MIVYTCPKCGKDLQFSVMTTYPQLEHFNVAECSSCGWREEKREGEIERIPYKITFYPPCQDCNTKMDEIRRAYDKLKNQESSDKASDKDKLDKIKAELRENIDYNKKMKYQGIVCGLLLALDIVDKNES